MIVQHATLKRNLRSIRRDGILTAYALGRRPAVWFHSGEREAWAFGHTVLRHGGRIQDVVAILVDVPDGLLKRHGAADGVWYCMEDVPPEWFRGTVQFVEVFKSEVKNG